ncbi:membrane protein [Shigella virus Moo19]|uniref:Uncharacterized protein n=1 Tax=Shigella virus Moo19 TaxID=2886042 RepID=A0AAE9C675_9CAUD|nr:membrane protein [Shigella virus Moo19]UEN68826.1 hypothetical protein Moo19_gp30 [Shigella virus Moo19]
MKFSDLLWAILFLLLTAFIYGVVLPNAVSASDSISVVIGLIVSIMWPVIAGRVVYLIVKKRKKKHA